MMKVWLCLVILLTLLAAVPMFAAVQYQVVDIGVCDFWQASPKINNYGQVAGLVGKQGINNRPIIWDNGVTTFIPMYGGSYGCTSDINNNGQVVGHSEGTDRNVHVYVWKDGNLSSPDTFGSSRSYIPAINDLGDVAYSADTPSGQPHLFLRKNGEIHDLGAPADSTDIAAFGGINDSGMIAGWYWIDQGNNLGGHAFVYHNGSMVDIGSLGGGQAVAHGLNNLGQVTGYSTTGVVGDVMHAFLWQNGVMADLGAYDQLDTYALSINNKSQVVGFATPGGFEPNLGLLRVNDQFVDLNTLISPESGWRVTAATDINDLGQIVGYGMLNGESHMILLNPVPEPSSLIALACGLGSIGGVICRKKRSRL